MPATGLAGRRRMSCGEKPTIEGFKAFFEDYMQACRDGDAAFLRRMLPETVPDDEFEFVLQSSREFAESVHGTGAAPEIVQDGAKFEAVYAIEEGGDTTEWRIDFHFCRGKWLKYDPGISGDNHPGRAAN